MKKRKQMIMKKQMKNEEICKNRLGMTFAIFFGGIHLIWALLVGMGVGQGILDWILPMHFIMNVFTVIGFNVITAVTLTALAFLGGYVMGWIIAWIWNLLK